MDHILDIGAKVRITKIDKHGWLGRELHPRDHHEGRMAFVTAVELLNEDGETLPDRTDVEDVSYALYHVETSTGEPLELLDFEVEPFFSVRRRAGEEQPGYFTITN